LGLEVGLEIGGLDRMGLGCFGLSFPGGKVAEEKVEICGEIPENRPSAAKAVLILLDLCTG